MRLMIHAGVGVFAVCLLGLSGCGGGEQAERAAVGEHEHEHADEHDHGEEGPHGGHIIELGDEDYHAELTHDDDAHRVGVYVLGADAKTPKPIAAESVRINVVVDGKPTQYELPAVPQEGEAEGQSSYFETVSEPLTVIVAGESEDPSKTQARLSFKVGEQGYTGLIETDPHEHDHDHGHAH